MAEFKVIDIEEQLEDLNISSNSDSIEEDDVDDVIDFDINVDNSEIEDPDIDTSGEVGEEIEIKLDDIDMSKEVWKKIPDEFELHLDNYEFSNYGRVKRLKDKKNGYGGILKCVKRKSGYMVVTLTSQKIKVTYFVHRLIGLAFLSHQLQGRDYKQLVINHINRIKNDNNAINLEWLTQKENSSSEKCNKPKTKPSVLKYILQIDPNTMKVIGCGTYKQALEFLNLKSDDGLRKSIKSGRLYKNFFWAFKGPDYIKGEIWKEVIVKGIKFQASSAGRVTLPSGKIVYGTEDGYGYYDVTVNDMKIKVHQIICTAFHGPNYDPTYTVDHINRISKDNTPENLRWLDKKGQCLNTRRVKNPLMNAKSVYQYEFNTGRLIQKYDRISDVKIVGRGYIQEYIINGKGDKYPEYLWSYEELDEEGFRNAKAKRGPNNESLNSTIKHNHVKSKDDYIYRYDFKTGQMLNRYTKYSDIKDVNEWHIRKYIVKNGTYVYQHPFFWSLKLMDKEQFFIERDRLRDENNLPRK